MIEEDYVSFETAKLLKEKGFYEPTIKSYYTDGFEYPMKFSHDLLPCIQTDEFLCPTLQMAMKWLREVHNIHISVDIHWLHFANQNGWMYIITKILENGTDYINSKGDENDKHFYSTYEEACESAIKHCIENLI